MSTTLKINTEFAWRKLKGVAVNANEKTVDDSFIQQRTLGAPFAQTSHLSAAVVGYVMVGQFSAWNVSMLLMGA
jgi:hypothetical protein